MARPGRMRSLLREILGHPEVSCRIPSTPAFTLERYRALLDVAKIPPLPEKLLWIHTGGKPIAYRARSATAERVSLPGLVTLVPEGVPGEVALRGVGEGMIAYFDGPRQVPAWVAARREREPVTIVDNVVVTLAQQLVAAASEPRRDDEYLATLGNAALAQVRHVLETTGTPQALRGSRSAQMLVHLAVQHIHEHLEQSLTVAGLAATVGVGVTHFSNTFRLVTGTTPHHYILRARIGRARELLRMTSLSVAEIAAAVGFAGQSHFCTAFGRETGVTPTEYRRSCRESAR
ncbi:MAG: helix-turn-helix transcriptional regulator [Gammaproteobacteria bacterium]|nr:helix-turn-helix transcriptional regulator [Gammaproteobacteria bacterium]